MALDFPTNPADGQVFDAYVWSAAKGVWQSREEQAAVTVISPTAPTSATNGDLWFNSNTGILFAYYDDGSTAQWVEVVNSGILDVSGKANLTGGNTFSGTQTFNTPISVSSGGTGSSTVIGAQTSLQISTSPNYIINGAFDVWQRGTSFTTLTGYGPDRWRPTINATGTNLSVSRVAGPTGALQYGARFLQAAAASSIVEYAARQFIETQHLAPIGGKQATLSFWYRSNRTGLHAARVTSATRATGGTDQSITFNVTSANTWTKYSLTFSSFAGVTAWTAADNDWGGFVDIGFRVGSSIGDFASLSTNDYFEIAGVQLEAGSVATEFKRNSGSLQGEIAACQRYFYRNSSTVQYTPLAFGYQITTTEVFAHVQLPVRMRIKPAVTASSMEWSDNALFQIGFSSLVVNNASNTDIVRLNATIPANGAQFRPGTFRTSAASLGYLEYNAEL